MGIDPAAVPVFEVITGGAVVDGNAAGVDLTAAALAISAGAAVGTATDPLDTAVGNLEVFAAGGVFVTDSGPALTVGGVLPTLAACRPAVRWRLPSPRPPTWDWSPTRST